MAEIECRYFSGFKPCSKNVTCDRNVCPSFNRPTAHVLIVHLEALGAVLRSTALLPAIRRKFSGCHITWVTQAPAHYLLQGNSFIDRILTTEENDLLRLKSLEFDVALVIDKSMSATGVLKTTSADLVYGFITDSKSGAVQPATPAATELWNLGLDNHLKFFKNQKTELQLVHEALELGPYARDGYRVELSGCESVEMLRRKQAWAGHRRFGPVENLSSPVILGINTGCAQTMPYKKPSTQILEELINHYCNDSRLSMVLLGGKEDTETHQILQKRTGVKVSPSQFGLRDGLVSVAACDIVFTGDSLGLHMAIALKKWIVAWFGPSCAQEIDLFENGVKVISDEPCSPCWKKECERDQRCNEKLNLGEIIAGIESGIHRLSVDEKEIGSGRTDGLSGRSSSWSSLFSEN